VKRERRLVLASDNQGKLAEMRALIADLECDLVSQAELGIGAAAEPHATFVENALAKARHVAAASGLPAIADDSGLCCRALGGAPGVQSARFAAIGAGAHVPAPAGRNSDDAQNNALLLQRLAGVRDRAAHYCCLIVALRRVDDPEPLIAEGRWEGEIVDEARGHGGFGYDPHFWIPELQCTAAQLPAERKNSLSHRGFAMRMIVPLLRQRWSW
jgi:XTP/dITP diphosphohydrolase